MDYRNKVILAPMVRVCSLAFRLLALEYGADIVYSEEIIDYKMTNAKRIENTVLNTIDFCVDGVEKPIFRTNSLEKGKIVFQLGTCDPERALQVCKIIENDVAAIDLNMGCPKEFSIQGGMGAALLKKPELVKKILTKLVSEVKVPITCKIRILPSIEETIEFCKMIESCGIKAIAVHGRFQTERPRNPMHPDYIQEIAKHIKIPIIANGGSSVINSYEDIEKFRELCGASSVMIGRQAMHNCSIFRKEGLLPLDNVIKRFLELGMDTDNFFFNTKYTVQQMLHEQLQTERGDKVLSSEIGEEIYELFGMLERYSKWKREYSNLLNENRMKLYNKELPTIEKPLEEIESEVHEKKRKLHEDGKELNLICKPAKYVKREFKDKQVSPKSFLFQYTIDKELPRPVYITEEKNKAYKSILKFQGKMYTTPQWEPSKQLTEQAAAIVCLEDLGIDLKEIKN